MTYVPPAEHSAERAQEYEQSYDYTWARAVDWFADHNVIIDKIEKSSGLLTAKYQMRPDMEDLDCGQIKVTGGTSVSIVQTGALNLTVRRVSEGETKVNVNFFGEVKVQYYNVGFERWEKFDGPCVSTGSLEKEILNFIGKEVARTDSPLPD